MKHPLIFSIFCAIVAGSMLFGWTCAVYGSEYLSPLDIDGLIDAIGKVESDNNDLAVGDGSKAIGRYQIHRAYWQDGCRFLKVDWPYEGAKNEIKARQLVKAYLTHYGKGLPLSALSRIHNGGPKGYLKPQTEAYWLKVEKVLHKKAT